MNCVVVVTMTVGMLVVPIPTGLPDVTVVETVVWPAAVTEAANNTRASGASVTKSVTGRESGVVVGGAVVGKPLKILEPSPVAVGQVLPMPVGGMVPARQTMVIVEVIVTEPRTAKLSGAFSRYWGTTPRIWTLPISELAVVGGGSVIVGAGVGVLTTTAGRDGPAVAVAVGGLKVPMPIPPRGVGVRGGCCALAPGIPG